MSCTEPFGVDQVERARRYHRPLYAASLVAIALDLSVLALLSFGPAGARLYGATAGWPWWGRGLSYALLVLALTALVGLPVSYWAGFRHEHAWGLSTQSLGAWSLDRSKAMAVGLVLGACGLIGLLAGARAWPRVWPIPVGLGAAAIVLFLGFVAPLLLEPLFNRFQPLADPELASGLQMLADRAGVPIERVLVADAGRRTRKLNAYVSGLGRTRRVVVFDTLLASCAPRELQLVVAAWALLDSSALRSAIGVDGPGDPRVIPFLLLVGSVLGLLASPLGAALSRRWERQADAFSLDLTSDPDAFESTHRRLALTNLADLDPPRLAYLAWATHPTAPERITAARRRDSR